MEDKLLNFHQNKMNLIDSASNENEKLELIKKFSKGF
jgi:hypothetical protein